MKTTPKTQTSAWDRKAVDPRYLTLRGKILYYGRPVLQPLLTLTLQLMGVTDVVGDLLKENEEMRIQRDRLQEFCMAVISVPVESILAAPAEAKHMAKAQPFAANSARAHGWERGYLSGMQRMSELVVSSYERHVLQQGQEKKV